MSPRAQSPSEPVAPAMAEPLESRERTVDLRSNRRAPSSTEQAELASEAELPRYGARRVVIERLTPQVDGGRFAVKRTLGEEVVVEADVFADGHDAVRCRLLHRAAESGSSWERCAMSPLGNDRWRGRFRAAQLGRALYT